MAFGTYKEVVSARATDKAIQKVAQDGGIVSALLCYALEENIIEGAIVAGDTEDAWKPEPTIAMTPEEIIAAAGTKYTFWNSLSNYGTQKNAILPICYQICSR